MRYFQLFIGVILVLVLSYTAAQASEPVPTRLCPSAVHTHQCGSPPASAVICPSVMAMPNQIITLYPSQATTKPSVNLCEWKGFVDVLAWPIVTLFGILLLVFTRRIRRVLELFFGRLTKIKGKGGGVELEFSVDTARDVSAFIKDDLAEYKNAAANEYDKQVRSRDLDTFLRVAKEAVMTEIRHAEGKVKGLRATVHVPDVVFKGSLYQLLDYHPYRRGRGRRWSERYGLIGRAWRMDQSLVTQYALGHDVDLKQQTAEHIERATQKLISSWGMTLKEAEEISSGELRQSCMCIVLRVNKRQVALLYLDAPVAEIFENAKKEIDVDSMEVNPSLEQLPEVQQLASEIDKALGELRDKGTYLEL